MADMKWRAVLMNVVLLGGLFACATGGQGSADDDDGGSVSTGSGSDLSSGVTTGSGSGGDNSVSGSVTGSTSTASSVGAGGAASSNATTTGAGGDCSESPCKVTSQQCGCATGEKCTLDNQGSRICMADGNVAIGEKCQGPVCVAGSMCLGGQAFANCKKFCDTDSECNAPGGLCIIEVDDGMGGAYKEKWCSDNCDPVSGAGCPTGSGKCEIGQESALPNRFFTTCLEAGKQTQGQACTLITDCASGFGCINYNSQDVCAKWCTVGKPNCPGITTCAQFSTPMMIGSVEYGACI